jgi:hypothetical protein
LDWSKQGVSALLPTGMATLLLADVEGSTRLSGWASARGHRGNLSLVKSMTTEFSIGLGDVTERRYMKCLRRSLAPAAPAVLPRRGWSSPFV